VDYEAAYLLLEQGFFTNVTVIDIVDISEKLLSKNSLPPAYRCC
jgi:hypothetical protein